LNESREEIAAIVRTARGFVEDRLRPHENAVDRADHIEEALIAELRAEAVAFTLSTCPTAWAASALARAPSRRWKK
jgi:hypothetical protein